jgi:pyridoxal phosphate enzyme (YggS family)
LKRDLEGAVFRNRKNYQMSIAVTLDKIRKEIPSYVTIVAAAKTRTTDEIKQIMDAGIQNIGENYLQEALTVQKALGPLAAQVKWHMIGHVQSNKIVKVLDVFDVIQTVDSLDLAAGISSRADKPVSVCVEINSGSEPQKTGFLPENAEESIRKIAAFRNIKIIGLMTMGPRFGVPEEARPFYRATKKLFDHIASCHIPDVSMDVLSMGMSNAYGIAIEEGATMIRLGTVLFGTCRAR